MKTVAVMSIIILAPAMLLIALSIWIEDRQTPFFFQRRYGKEKRQFQLMKFRTMKILKANETRLIEDMEMDNRVTKVGKILRLTHLDELPQIINIIKGDMNIVGPRPIPCNMNVTDIQNWNYRSTIKPGLTGLAQIHCTKYTTLRNKFKFDAVYVKRKSWRLDIKLIVATTWKIRRLLSFILWTVVILLAMLLPIPEETIPAIGSFNHVDKLVHYFLFLIMATSAICFFCTFTRLSDAFHIAIGWCLLLAIFTEGMQSLLPIRNMSILDFAADIIGTSSGAVVWLLTHQKDVVNDVKGVLNVKR